MTMKNFTGIDILSTGVFVREDIDHVLDVAEKFYPVATKQETSKILEGKVLGALFYEPSTRTRSSFEAAMNRLGGRVITVASAETTSLSKGETLYDTGKMMECYCDVIAMRHPQKGSVAELARGANVPVLNAGDGPGEHPTQALLDMFTIRKERGKIDGLTIAMVGDLKFGRTVHSLSYLLSHYKVKLIFVSPAALKMPDYVKKILTERGVAFEETENLEEGMAKSEVLYDTRVQKERFEDLDEYERLKHYYVLTKDLIERVNPTVTIMHPLPRIGEIHESVDELVGAAYFRQAQNGVAVRMALLALVLGKV